MGYLPHAKLYPTTDWAQFHGIVFFSALLQISQLLLDFQMFGLSTISRNAHLVHQNWYRISFTF
jgi:hypothetical protein